MISKVQLRLNLLEIQVHMSQEHRALGRALDWLEIKNPVKTEHLDIQDLHKIT